MRHLAAAPLIGAFVAILLDGPLGAQERGSSIGYPSVDAARKELLAKPGVRAVEQQGWLIIDDQKEMSLWSFTPQSHEAHPAAVKRTILKKDGAMFVRMNVLCGASKEACDRLVAEFNALNDRMRQDIERRRPKS